MEGLGSGGAQDFLSDFRLPSVRQRKGYAWLNAPAAHRISLRPRRMMAKPKASESLIIELERATHSGSPERCAETMRRVTELFLTGADRYSEDQVLLFESVLELLVERIERRARAELSTQLALVDNAPIRTFGGRRRTTSSPAPS